MRIQSILKRALVINGSSVPRKSSKEIKKYSLILHFSLLTVSPIDFSPFKIEELVMKCVTIATNLRSEQQIECSLEGAILLKQAGFIRKYCFLLYQTAATWAENENYDGAALLVSDPLKGQRAVNLAVSSRKIYIYIYIPLICLYAFHS
jgi:hypothetical protein